MSTESKTDREWIYHYGFTDGMKSAYFYPLVRGDLKGNTDYEQGFLDGADTGLNIRGYKTLIKSRQKEIQLNQNKKRPDNQKPEPLKKRERWNSDDSMDGIQFESMLARIYWKISKLWSY